MPALPPEPPGCPRAREPRPLPDPEAVRLCLIPDPAPPYDGEAGTASNPDRLSGLDRPSALGSDRPTALGSDRPSALGSDRPTALGSDRPSAGGTSKPDSPADATPKPAGQGRAPDGWPSRFAQVLVETLAGSRPPRQIAPWTTEQARNHIQRLGPHLASAQQPRVRRVVTSRPASDVLEMTVVAGFGTQVRALAVRLERASSVPADRRRAVASAGWLCTAVEAA
jgi:hypothetical protein